MAPGRAAAQQGSPQAALAHTPLPAQQLPREESAVYTPSWQSSVSWQIRNHHLHRPCGAVPPPKGNLSPGTPVLAQLSLCFVIQMLLGVADSIWSYMNENQSVTSHSSREGLMLATATV